ncbi:MAG TPA: hypothetical protein VFA18_21990 [Gemmataceae bacterium]|nr:hypothetical protein [Gemmataceae bacterium]
MRQLFIIMVGWSVCWIGSEHVRADQSRDRALAVIERAINAQGGAQRLARLQTYERTAWGKQLLTNQEVDFTTTLTVAFPKRMHDHITVQLQGSKTELVQVLDGDKAWRTVGDKTNVLSKEETADLREELYLMRVSTLLPLKEEGFGLKLLPDIKVDGRLTHVVQVEHKGHAAVKLSIDARNYLLIKMEHRTRQATLTVVKEYRLSDYKEFEGLRLPTKQTEYTNGNKAGELTTTGYRFLEKADQKLFEQAK